jgi:hypothetical protein
MSRTPGPGELEINCFHCGQNQWVVANFRKIRGKVIVSRPDDCTNYFRTFNAHVKCPGCGLCFPKNFSECPTKFGGCGRKKDGSENRC